MHDPILGDPAALLPTGATLVECERLYDGRGYLAGWMIRFRRTDTGPVEEYRAPYAFGPPVHRDD